MEMERKWQSSREKKSSAEISKDKFSDRDEEGKIERESERKRDWIWGWKKERRGGKRREEKRREEKRREEKRREENRRE
jgi:hypothetical protein